MTRRYWSVHHTGLTPLKVFVRAQKPKCHLVLTNLEDIVSRFHICDVNPLAVDVCIVGIITTWAQALHSEQDQ